MSTAYETDVIAWAQEQAALLRCGQWSLIDVEHIAEEILEMGESKQREFSSRMAVLLAHLLSGLGSDLLEMRDVYKDDERTAGALFKISPPPGCSEAQFISRAQAAGKTLNDFLRSKHIAYMERNGLPSGVTCDTGALAILENLGLRGRQFLAMTNDISTANPGVTGLDDVGALTPYAGKDAEIRRTVAPEMSMDRNIDEGMLRGLQVVYHDRLSEMKGKNVC